MVRWMCKPPREWPSSVVPLAMGLGWGATLVVGGLGLRAPVLIGALLPPVVAGRIWWRRQRALTERAVADGDLLDPWILERRLARLQIHSAERSSESVARWRALLAELEGIRQLAARCAALDPSSALSLLLMLEGLLDRLQEGGDPEPPGPTELPIHLFLCRAHLARVHQEALRFIRRHPGQPLLLPPLPARFLP